VGALHHVVVRGIERRKIFRHERDHEDFLSRLEREQQCDARYNA
jgi:hypothetical protein